LIGDPTRLRQILVNLIDNAIKFTERGDVMLRVKSESEPGEKLCLHFSITDTGIGIPTAKQARIFEVFTQADGSTTRTHGGVGLGLAIASQLVRQMGGRIWVESTMAVGTTFHFTVRLPMRPTPIAEVRHADLGRLKGVRVLVVDDNAVNRRILQAMLRNWGMLPTLVASGAAALEEMLRCVHEETPFPLVLLDGMMPEMDGFEATRQIRKAEQGTSRHIRIAAMTARAMVGDRERCLDAGMDDYFSKPLNKAEIQALLIGISARINGTGAEASRQPGLVVTP
jgi:two-component system, sensor histidine kinase and response regulator